MARHVHVFGLLAVTGVLSGCSPGEPPPEPTTVATAATAPEGQPGTTLGVYALGQHPLYDGRFVVTGSRVYQAGTLSDASPWDHMGDDGTNLRAVDGTIEIDVDERANTGTFRADLMLPEGNYIVELERVRRILAVSGWRHCGMAVRTRRLWVRGHELAEEHPLRGRLGMGPRDPRRRTASLGRPDSLHGDTGHAGPGDARGASRSNGRHRCRCRQPRGRPGGLLHPQPGDQRRESPESGNLRPLLRDGNDLALARSEMGLSAGSPATRSTQVPQNVS